MFGLVDCNNFYVSCERVFNPRLQGRPVAVLSNNDGCVVARSPEFRALGIPVGTPHFKLKPIERLHGLVFLSSNYELYADMSRRVMSILREMCPRLEPYSIDEAFLELRLAGAADGEEASAEGYLRFGERVRERIRRWVGIPVGIGFARTKTLAKVASKLAKRSASGVFVMPPDASAVLADFPAADVWGIGGRLRKRLHLQGIETALQLARLDVGEVTRTYGVCLARTVLELGGKSALPLDAAPAPLKSVTCSRMFGTPVTTLDELRQAFLTYASDTAERLRRHGRLAAGAVLFAQYADEETGAERRQEYHALCGETTVVFPEPTANNAVIFDAMAPAIPRLFRPHTRHRKCGVILFGLEQAEHRQLELFTERDARPQVPDALYHTLDAINARFGKNTVFALAEGIEKNWSMRRGNLSRRYTTDWEELLTVR